MFFFPNVYIDRFFGNDPSPLWIYSISIMGLWSTVPVKIIWCVTPSISADWKITNKWIQMGDVEWAFNSFAGPSYRTTQKSKVGVSKQMTRSLFKICRWKETNSVINFDTCMVLSHHECSKTPKLSNNSKRGGFSKANKQTSRWSHGVPGATTSLVLWTSFKYSSVLLRLPTRNRNCTNYESHGTTLGLHNNMHKTLYNILCIQWCVYKYIHTFGFKGVDWPQTYQACSRH